MPKQWLLETIIAVIVQEIIEVTVKAIIETMNGRLIKGPTKAIIEVMLEVMTDATIEQMIAASIEAMMQAIIETTIKVKVNLGSFTFYLNISDVMMWILMCVSNMWGTRYNSRYMSSSYFSALPMVRCLWQVSVFIYKVVLCWKRLQIVLKLIRMELDNVTSCVVTRLKVNIKSTAYHILHTGVTRLKAIIISSYLLDSSVNFRIT